MDVIVPGSSEVEARVRLQNVTENAVSDFGR